MRQAFCRIHGLLRCAHLHLAPHLFRNPRFLSEDYISQVLVPEVRGCVAGDCTADCAHEEHERRKHRIDRNELNHNRGCVVACETDYGCAGGYRGDHSVAVYSACPLVDSEKEEEYIHENSIEKGKEERERPKGRSCKRGQHSTDSSSVCCSCSLDEECCESEEDSLDNDEEFVEGRGNEDFSDEDNGTEQCSNDQSVDFLHGQDTY